MTTHLSKSVFVLTVKVTSNFKNGKNKYHNYKMMQVLIKESFEKKS